MAALARSWLLVLALASSGFGASAGEVNPFESESEPVAACKIDQLVFGRLNELGIEPAHVCSDAVFVRRVFLDLIGTLPTEQETRAFLSNRNPNKRAELIDRLLERDEFADYWAMKWSELLRVKAEFPINLWPNAVQAYHRWIRTSIKQNTPYNDFVRELLMSSGSNFRAPPANFYRAIQNRSPEGIAEAVALTFMGTRTDKWPSEKLSELAVFFSRVGYKSTAEWKEEIVFCDYSKEGRVPGPARFPDGTAIEIAGEDDPRELFADWLITPDNAWFARNIVNRTWSWLFGRGIVHEPDDIRPDNPPSHPDVLNSLEKELAASGYDLKHIFRLIANSATYQLSSVPRSDHPKAEIYFAHYALRRVEAEVLIDALNQITGTTERYSSAIPEPFTFIPEDHRSIQLADGSITSSFLEMFGRAPRDTGLESERNNRVTAAQRLHLLNSSHIQRKLEQGSFVQSLGLGRRDPRDIIARVYLTILSRFPTQEELNAVSEYSQSGIAKGREVPVDIAWALINLTSLNF